MLCETQLPSQKLWSKLGQETRLSLLKRLLWQRAKLKLCVNLICSTSLYNYNTTEVMNNYMKITLCELRSEELYE